MTPEQGTPSEAVAGELMEVEGKANSHELNGLKSMYRQRGKIEEDRTPKERPNTERKNRERKDSEAK